MVHFDSIREEYTTMLQNQLARGNNGLIKTKYLTDVYKRQMWDFSVIKDLLMNPVDTGAIASQKKDYRFKIGTIGEKKPEDWIVVEGSMNR